MIRYTSEQVIEAVMGDLLKKNLDVDQIMALMKLTPQQFEAMMDRMTKNGEYFPPEIAGILADAFGYNRLFLIDGQMGMFYDFRNEDDMYKMWKEEADRITHDYFYRITRCWDHPKAREIFDLYKEVMSSNSKMEIMLKTQRIEDLFEELLKERDEKEQ